MATSGEALLTSCEASIKLPVFEGPLDLLLFLIRKNEIDIYDIPIETVTRQYLDLLYKMEKLHLEVAGEFFVVAATLMYIKSRLLLPKDKLPVESRDEEEAIDPRWELVQQLVEYKKFKEAAGDLEILMAEAQNLLPRYHRVAEEEKPHRPLKPTDKIELWNVFNHVLRRLAEKIAVGHIHGETVTVADRMEYILDLLQTQSSFLFSSLFTGKDYNLNLVVATFLAILELARLKKITLSQEENFTDISCTACAEEAVESSFALTE